MSWTLANVKLHFSHMIQGFEIKWQICELWYKLAKWTNTFVYRISGISMCDQEIQHVRTFSIRCPKPSSRTVGLRVRAVLPAHARSGGGSDAWLKYSSRKQDVTQQGLSKNKTFDRLFYYRRTRTMRQIIHRRVSWSCFAIKRSGNDDDVAADLFLCASRLSQNGEEAVTVT